MTAIIWKPEKVSDVTWDTVKLLVKGTQFVIWSRKNGTLLPNLNAELDPDDLYPEGNVTKQFWMNLYEGIDKWRNESKY